MVSKAKFYIMTTSGDLHSSKLTPSNWNSFLMIDIFLLLCLWPCICDLAVSNLFWWNPWVLNMSGKVFLPVCFLEVTGCCWMHVWLLNILYLYDAELVWNPVVEFFSYLPKGLHGMFIWAMLLSRLTILEVWLGCLRSGDSPGCKVDIKFISIRLILFVDIGLFTLLWFANFWVRIFLNE